MDAAPILVQPGVVATDMLAAVPASTATNPAASNAPVIAAASVAPVHRHKSYGLWIGIAAVAVIAVVFFVIKRK